MFTYSVTKELDSDSNVVTTLFKTDSSNGIPVIISPTDADYFAFRSAGNEPTFTNGTNLTAFIAAGVAAGTGSLTQSQHQALTSQLVQIVQKNF